MRYAILIYQAEGAMDHFTDDEVAQATAAHGELQKEMKAAGQMLLASQLMEGYSASTVRTDGSRVTVKDGPFAASKELLLGFYLVDCPDLDTALGYAARIPHAAWGTIEVRPVAYYDAP